jgi:hypothetical protein
MMLRPDQFAAPLYRRSPFQIALLLFVTFGLYVFYWAYMVRRCCSFTLERTDQPVWKAAALIIPIFNLFLLYDLGMLIKGVAFRAGVTVMNLIAMLGIVAFILAVFRRAPMPYDLIGYFSFVPLVAMYFPFERAQLVINGNAAAPQKFSVIEWIVLVVFGLLHFDLLAAYFLAGRDGEIDTNRAVIACVIYVAAIGILAIIKGMSDRLVKASYPGMLSEATVATA